MITPGPGSSRAARRPSAQRGCRADRGERDRASRERDPHPPRSPPPRCERTMHRGCWNNPNPLVEMQLLPTHTPCSRASGRDWCPAEQDAPWENKTEPSTSYSGRRPTVESVRLLAQKSVKGHLLHKTPVNNEIHPVRCTGYSRLVWDSQPSKWSSWCSWLSRQSNTLKVLGSNPGEDILFCFFPKALRANRTTRATSAHVPATSRIDQEGWRRRRARLDAPIAGILAHLFCPCVFFRPFESHKQCWKSLQVFPF